MKLIAESITVKELGEVSRKMFGNLVKAVVDVEKEIMVIDAQMHSDEEEFLLEVESQQADLWGINLYPDKFETDDFIEFDSMINIRPNQGNRTRAVESAVVRKKIVMIISR